MNNDMFFRIRLFMILSTFLIFCRTSMFFSVHIAKYVIKPSKQFSLFMNLDCFFPTDQRNQLFEYQQLCTALTLCCIYIKHFIMYSVIPIQSLLLMFIHLNPSFALHWYIHNYIFTNETFSTYYNALLDTAVIATCEIVCLRVLILKLTVCS